MSTQKPISSKAYDDEWLAAAWGNSANQSLLTGDPITPRPRISRVIELAALTPGLTVLDIACGRGEFPIIAGYQGVTAMGIDFSFHALTFANKARCVHIDQLPEPATLDLIQADATLLPFLNNSFDRITLLDIIEHLTPQQLDAMLVEVKRILKPEGFAIIHTLPNQWVYNITFPLLNKFSAKFPKNPRGRFDKKIHINEQTLPGLHQTLTRSGLNHHLWLEQHMASQARWNAGKDVYGDNRDSVYPILAGSLGRLLEIASLTPLKLILSNDIFGILWKSKSAPRTVKGNSGLIERVAMWMLERFYK